jgi:hypothetical protein
MISLTDQQRRVQVVVPTVVDVFPKILKRIVCVANQGRTSLEYPPYQGCQRQWIANNVWMLLSSSKTTE